MKMLMIILLLATGQLVGGAVKLKFAIIAPERSIWGKKFKDAADEVEKQTNGQVKIHLYYGGVQGDELKVIQKMQIGQLQGAGFMARGMSKVCPDSLAFAIPLLFHDDDEAITMNEKMQDYFNRKAQERGFEIIGWTNQGFTYCFSKDRVTNISELREAKPWMLENDDFCKSFFKCSNITAVPVQVGDVMTALQTGMIHTVFTPPIGMIIMQWHTRVKYRLDLGLFYSFGAVVVTSKAWNKIPENQQIIVRKILHETIKELNQQIKNQNDDALKVLGKTIETVTPSKEAVEEFRSITANVEEDMTNKTFSSEAMELLKKNLNEYRASKQNGKKN